MGVADAGHQASLPVSAAAAESVVAVVPRDLKVPVELSGVAVWLPGGCRCGGGGGDGRSRLAVAVGPAWGSVVASISAGDLRCATDGVGGHGARRLELHADPRDREVTGEEVVLAGVGASGEGRILFAADVLRVGAAGFELAARRKVGEVRGTAADGGQAGVAGHLQLGDRLQQRLGVGVADPGEELVGRRLFHDAPGVHDGDVVGPTSHHAKVVGDQDDRHLPVPLHVLQQVEDLGLDGDVEGRWWAHRRRAAWVRRRRRWRS